MNVNDKLYGFSIKEKHEIFGLGATMYVMEHEKSGARLIYLDRDDENKTFSIAFKTLPIDSTGVFHILEHSVLCGSEKYRLKDPFVELISGSLNTFLNAMTFSDKTMYPVASTNEKEFLNLADVYLDAVFHPLAVKDKKAFMQEGWHYELLEDGTLSYKGVVLNEMRGDYSSPESVTDRYMRSMLFSNTCYEHDSGGAPSDITNLTFEQFVDSHNIFYHPSNSVVFLDGSLDINAALKLVSSYLEPYDRISLDDERFKFKPSVFKKERCEGEYEIAENEDTKDKTRLALAHLTFRFDQREKIFGAAILSSALLSSNESEIKKKILASGLCEDLAVNIGEGIYQNYFEVDFINVKDGFAGELEKLFYDTVADVAAKGIEKAQLLAAINSLEFSLRERDFGTLPLGIIYAMNTLETYLYSDDALSGLTFEDEIKFLRENMDGGFFEELLLEIFIKNESAASLVLHPSKDLGQRQRAQEEKKLSEIRASMSREELETIKRENEELLAWQSSEDSEEAKETIPRLCVSDISSEVADVPTTVSEISGTPLIMHPMSTNGISYTELYFDVSDLECDEIFTAAVLGLVLGNLSTEKYSATELVRVIKSELGSLSAGLKIATRVDGSTKIYFKAFLSMLAFKKDAALDLLTEVLTKTSFEDKDAIRNIVKQAYIASEESFAAAGHRAAKSRASAMLFSEDAAMEYYSGYEAHKCYKKLSKNFDESYGELKEKLYAFIKKYLVRERLILSHSEDEPCADSNAFLSSVSQIFPTINEKVEPVCKIKPLKKQKEAIRIPAKVGFSSLAIDLCNELPAGSGLYDVLANFASYEYLWGEVRVKGGAYGAGMRAARNGLVSYYSYRDPTPKRSVGCFESVPDFLEKTFSSDKKLDKYIIGAIGDSSPYLTPRTKASVGTLRYLNGLTKEIRQRLRSEILSANSENLRELAVRLGEKGKDAAFCIIGPSDKIEDCGADVILEI